MCENFTPMRVCFVEMRGGGWGYRTKDAAVTRVEEENEKKEKKDEDKEEERQEEVVWRWCLAELLPPSPQTAATRSFLMLSHSWSSALALPHTRFFWTFVRVLSRGVLMVVLIVLQGPSSSLLLL